MKIKISEDEVYKIKIPEEIGIQEFQSIVMKFNFLLKNFAKFNIGETLADEEKIILQKKQYKKRNNGRWEILRENRDIFVDILKKYYIKTNEELIETLKKYNLDFKRVDFSTGQMLKIRELHQIKPEEVGLIKFPSRTKPFFNLRLSGDKTNYNLKTRWDKQNE